MFIMSAADAVDRIATAAAGVEGGDLAVVQRAGHSLKSTADKLGLGARLGRPI